MSSGSFCFPSQSELLHLVTKSTIVRRGELIDQKCDIGTLAEDFLVWSEGSKAFSPQTLVSGGRK